MGNALYRKVTSSSVGGVLLHTLNNPSVDTPAGDIFGTSVAVSGNYCIIGAPQDSEDMYCAGKAYIFDATTGNLLHTLDDPGALSGAHADFFGYSVGISGNRCIVGAYYEDDAGGSYSGKAYIFDVITGNLLHTLDNPNAYGTSASDYFGLSVAISGNYCIVGAFLEDEGAGSGSGSAYIFDVVTGNLLHTLNNPNVYGTPQNDYFGESVAISGDKCIVSSHYEDEAAGENSGKVYIFDVVTGNLLHTLDNPNAYGTPINDYFGESVAISGDKCIIGTHFENELGYYFSGKAYIFDVLTGNLLNTLDNPNSYGTPQDDYFGTSVAISGNRCIVNAANEDDVGGNYSGKAYIFDVLTGELLHTLDNPNAYGTSADDYFGVSVAISETHCIVGAYMEDEAAGNDSGKAYIFSLGGTVSSWKRVRNIRRKGGAVEAYSDLPSEYQTEVNMLVIKEDYLGGRIWYFTSSGNIRYTYSALYGYTISVIIPCYYAIYQYAVATSAFTVYQEYEYKETGFRSITIAEDRNPRIIYNNFDVYDWDGKLVKSATLRDRCLRFKPPLSSGFTGRINI